MKISSEKSKFYQREVEFLGYIVAKNIIKTDPRKVEAIQNYPIPKTLRQLRGFLGLTGYYRKFIHNYAVVAKPLTKHLQGENGKISQYLSKKKIVSLDQDVVAACDKLKNLLAQQVELTQPDYNKKFVLTTDASNVALGAVLSQEGKPIVFISKTLNSTEFNYATNEKELFAIVWALKALRNYLYGVSDLEIHTDHQPLSFAISERNPNIKIKRWRSFIEEFSPKIIYKPGATNVVADALSRQMLNNLTNSKEHSESSDSLADTQHSAESKTFNDARILVHDNRRIINKTNWSKISKLLIKLRLNLYNVKEKYQLDIFIPTVLNSPLTLHGEEDQKSVETDLDSDPESNEETDIKENDLKDLTIPAQITLSEEDNEIEQEEGLNSSTSSADTEEYIMTDVNAQRAYIKDISNAIPEFNGQKIHLQRFVTALKLINLTKGTFEEIAVEVIKSKIVGSTLYKVQNETTINAIIKKLQDTIVGETSDVVKAKLSKTMQKGKTAEKFTTEIDNLRKLLEASYIDEGLSAEHADKFSTKEAINTMVKNCEHGKLKTILEAGNFKTMDEAVTKYIQCSTEMTGNPNSILLAQRGRGNYNNRNNYRGRGNGRGNGRGYYNNNNYNNNNRNNGQNNNYQYNNYRGNNRGNNRVNHRGNNHQNGGYNQNSYNNVRVTQNASGNSQQPLDTQQ
ncbi:basic-leucine zipper transcription factor A-like [Anastrepha obliqua]|uniref:basic-leucine zipper transcription factor A-like n=1 Tax=Anastrepha obliqua TaxID=95512 RepID=UPI0024097C33|nr:basic-leucine zipper transcription factor A-like [Anastrepha obliqua]